MRVLVACEFSGRVRNAFLSRGHDAWSCDYFDSPEPREKHIRGDVTNLLGEPWDLIIAHPPCTYLCNSGVRWLSESKTGARMELVVKGAKFFLLCLNANAAKIVVENPIPHKYALEIIGRKYDQIIHPWQFGHMENKSTCLWLKGLPKLLATKIMSIRNQSLARMPPDRGLKGWRSRMRSITFQGIAEAFATQYGGQVC